MPRAALDDNGRMNLRVGVGDKAKLVRAAGLVGRDLTGFVVESALREAEAVIASAEVQKVSRRDFEAVMDLLENPPVANAKMRRAAKGLPPG